MILSIRDFDSYINDKMHRISHRGEQILKEDIMTHHYSSGKMLLDVHTEWHGAHSFSITTDPTSYDSRVLGPGNMFHYAPIVRDGRGPVTVHPPKRALKFTVNGQTLFRHSVGPYKGDAGFPKRARDRLSSEISNI